MRIPANFDRDNIEAPGGFALLLSPTHVALHLPMQDGIGRWVEIPHAEFEFLARWYVSQRDRPATPTPESES